MKIRRSSGIAALLFGVSVTLGSCAIMAEREYGPYPHHYGYDYYYYQPHYYRPHHHHHHGGYYRMRLDSDTEGQHMQQDTHVSVSVPTR